MFYVSATYLASIIEKCVSLGADREGLLSLLPHNGLHLPDMMQKYDADLLLAVYDATANQISEPDIGVRVGLVLDMSTLNQTGKLLPACASIYDAIKMTGRYHRLTQNFGQTELVIDGDLATMRWHELHDNTERYRQATIAVLTGFIIGAKWLLWGRDDMIESVSFRCSPPEDMGVYKEAYPCDVNFGQPLDCMVFRTEALNLLLPTANAQTFDSIVKILDKLLVSFDEESYTIEAALAAIRIALPEGMPKLAQIANEVGQNERALRRILSNNDLTFRGLIKEARIDACMRYMQRDMQMQDIAYLLAFHDQAAFNRAFKAWFDINPKQYQKAEMHKVPRSLPAKLPVNC